MTIAAAPQTARKRPSVAGRVEDARARLRVVPDRVPGAPRLPFVVLVSMILVGGVVGLLVFNTSMQQSAFQEQKLQEEATNLAAREETLDGQLQKMEDPHAIASKAQRLGMVVPQNPAVLRVPDGKVEGRPAPADRSATPPLHEKVTKPPSVRLAEQRAAEERKRAEEAAAKKKLQEAQAALEKAKKAAGVTSGGTSTGTSGRVD